MKFPRSFSLLTFLMVATIVAIAFALYQANNEVAETRAKFARYSEEMGFIDVVDKSRLHFRRLGGYPMMGFAFRYHLPESAEYVLHIGSGIADPKTGIPPDVFSCPLTCENEQGTLVVNLEQMPTNFGKRWVVDTIIEDRLSRHICDDPIEFTWLQTYLHSFPEESGMSYRSAFNSVATGGHHATSIEAVDKDVILYRKQEFHPSAEKSLTDELLRNRKTFQIWLEPVKLPDLSSKKRSTQPTFRKQRVE